MTCYHQHARWKQYAKEMWFKVNVHALLIFKPNLADKTWIKHCISFYFTWIWRRSAYRSHTDMIWCLISEVEGKFQLKFLSNLRWIDPTTLVFQPYFVICHLFWALSHFVMLKLQKCIKTVTANHSGLREHSLTSTRYIRIALSIIPIGDCQHRKNIAYPKRCSQDINIF